MKSRVVQYVCLGLIGGLLLIAALALAGCGPADRPGSEPSGGGSVPLSVGDLQPTGIAPAQIGPTSPSPTHTAPPPASASDDEPVALAGGRIPSGNKSVSQPAQPAAGAVGKAPQKPEDGQAITTTGRLDFDDAPNQGKSAQQQSYTWKDGDRTLTVALQGDLTVTPEGDIRSRQDTQAVTTRSDAPDKAASAGLPVFRSESGMLMTLPGGVLLALDKTWTEAQTEAFFEDNGIAAERVSELEYIANGFYVETEPGWASLELANALATQEGVRISSPNWRQDLEAR